MKKNSNSFFIGLISFFGGISQDLILPILPIYFATVLGLDKSFIGLSEGLVTSISSISKIISGVLTDKFKSRKSIIFVGYVLSLISRPLLAIITISSGLLALRFIDGVGKGIKDSPKDALIADSTEKKTRGRGFGIVRALDTFGSVVGPLILFLLLYLLQNNNFKYHYIFFLSAIPLFFTLVILILFVKETSFHQTKDIKLNNGFKLPKGFYIFLLITIIFSLGYSSDAFLILRAQNVGVTLLAIPLVYALFNLFYASFSVPLGSLSDKIGREKIILLGWFAYALAYLGFGLANQSYQIWLLFAFYGIYYATTEGVAKAFIADLIPSEFRGRAYGIYNTAVGLVTLPASILAGFFWDKFNPSAPFLFGALMAMIAAFSLFIFTLKQPARV